MRIFIGSIALLLVGAFSHTYYGTDGIVGLIVGLSLIYYSRFKIATWSLDELPKSEAFLYRHRKVITLVGFGSLVGGILDMTKIF